MEENVDVKALRAKLHAQLGIAGSGTCTSTKPQPAKARSEPVSNSVLQNKLSAVSPRPVNPLNPTSEQKLSALVPHGFLRRSTKKQQSESTNGVRAKLTEELLQSKIVKQHNQVKSPTNIKNILSKKSTMEVAPLRKPLPVVGKRPSKPKRPPSVNLDHFQGRFKTIPVKQCWDSKSINASPGPPRPPNKPKSFSETSAAEEQDTYDDISTLPPPPPTPSKIRADLWMEGSPSIFEDSDQDIYEDIDKPEPISPPVPAERSISQDIKHKELDMKELKDKQKREQEYKKRFKIIGPIEVIHNARVREDWQGGKNDLMVRQGENVDIIRVNNNPEGKWLARNQQGSIGYVRNSCVDVDYEEVKRKIRGQSFLSAGGQAWSLGAYDNSSSMRNSFQSDEVYDDVEQVGSEEFPPPPPEISHDPKKTKKQEREEKEFRKKFKFDGPIHVLYTMMVSSDAILKKPGSKELAVMNGEIVYVLQETSQQKVLCQNEQGKYGYVPLHYLQDVEEDFYDDVDAASDIYDNDES